MVAPRVRSEVYVPSFHERIDLCSKKSTSAPSSHALPSNMNPAPSQTAPLRSLASLASVCLGLCDGTAVFARALAHQVCSPMLIVYFP
eukprot:1710421-Pleurochrysis_carterae.AAC.1